mmetsp:Transcript_59143/g.105552  ORF Transcript_59143/g.105552 Transcript_59143/m.105552 type:complete len:86 (-) Transcript_59143:567-824(-)
MGYRKRYWLHWIILTGSQHCHLHSIISWQTTQSNNVSHSQAILLDKCSPSATQNESIIGASVEQSDRSFLAIIINKVHRSPRILT